MEKDSTISWYDFTHPNLEAIKKRDEFLNDDSIHIIQMDNNGIIAEVILNGEQSRFSKIN